jgi:hypothetical protein
LAAVGFFSEIETEGGRERASERQRERETDREIELGRWRVL